VGGLHPTQTILAGVLAFGPFVALACVDVIDRLPKAAMDDSSELLDEERKVP
jgi:hypothetical protein